MTSSSSLRAGRSQVMRVLQDVLVPFQIYLNYRLIQTII